MNLATIMHIAHHMNNHWPAALLLPAALAGRALQAAVVPAADVFEQPVLFLDALQQAVGLQAPMRDISHMRCEGLHRPFFAMAWSSTCYMNTFYPNGTVPAIPLANISRNAYTCEQFENVVPLVVSKVDVKTMSCDFNPVGNKSCSNVSWPAYLNTNFSASGGAPNGTAGQPVGRRGIEIAGGYDVNAIQFDWVDDIGPPPGAPSQCEKVQSSPACHPYPCKTRTCPFSGIWWEHAVAARRVQSQKYFAEFSAAGGTLDFLSEDTEMGEMVWAMHFAGSSVPRACAKERWLQIEQDPRWPADLAELTRRGFVADTNSSLGHSGYLGRSMNVTVATRFYDYMTCVDNHRSDHQQIITLRVLAICKNQAVFNQFVAERMADGWTKSYFEPAQRHWPAIQASNYDMSLQTSTFCYGRLAGSQCFTGAATLLGHNLSGVVVGNTGTTSLYSVRPRSLRAMSIDVHVLRSNAVAAAETNTTVWPWLTPRPLVAQYSDELEEESDWRWLVEKVHHMMLSTSGVSAHLQQGVFWYKYEVPRFAMSLPAVNTSLLHILDDS